MSDITAETHAIEADHKYEVLENLVKVRIAQHKGPLFTVDTADRLWGAYLSNIPAEHRQHYNCNCCKNFVERVGGLVVILPDGTHRSVLWDMDEDAVPEFFKPVVEALNKIVEQGRVNGVFLSSDPEFGTERSPKGWTHLHAPNPNIFYNALLTPFQRAAELKEQYGLVQRTIAEYNLSVVSNAVRILEAGVVAGEEKAAKIAKWYFDLLTKLESTKNRKQKENIVWFAVSTAPPGFAHLKNGMVGTMLESLKAGDDFEAVKAKWNEKMHPLKYRRPTAEVSEGQINAAEKLVEKLGLQKSFERRFATASELKYVIWQPETVVPATPSGGVFGKLRNQPEQTKIILPNQRMTWAKFQRDVLPNMKSCELNVPRIGSFVAITSAVHMDAPPILQWDLEQDRNPTAYYVYHGGSYAANWNLIPGWTKVDRLAWAPYGVDMGHMKKFILFNIEKATDTHENRRGIGLFPSFLKSELKAIDKVIERLNMSSNLEGSGNANGYLFDDNSPVHIRVNGDAEYTLDRWE